jgi:very-short-patch-repair endonuclease
MRTGQIPDRARSLRRNQTDVEHRPWRLLRDRRLKGFKFRRQQAIGPCSADFACIEKRLAIEADDGQHSDRAGYDQARTDYLESCGYRVTRFWNHEVMQAGQAVLEEILRVLRAQ